MSMFHPAQFLGAGRDEHLQMGALPELPAPAQNMEPDSTEDDR
ncbi:hypothetical protein [Allochromatium tepidum]|nr:hypothetical protein [Allochromatium tepidum]